MRAVYIQESFPSINVYKQIILAALTGMFSLVLNMAQKWDEYQRGKKIHSHVLLFVLSAYKSKEQWVTHGEFYCLAILLNTRFQTSHGHPVREEFSSSQAPFHTS